VSLRHVVIGRIPQVLLALSTTRITSHDPIIVAVEIEEVLKGELKLDLADRLPLADIERFPMHGLGINAAIELGELDGIKLSIGPQVVER
jgi:hypothetical protein